MITIIARIKIKPGNEAEAEKAATEMAAAVEANEPGAIAYLMHRNQRDPTDITVFEVYEDTEAFAAHGQTAHMAALQGKLAQVADLTAIKIERLERFAGFVRQPG
jgi:quinol monooxygenase YgiN